MNIRKPSYWEDWAMVEEKTGEVLIYALNLNAGKDLFKSEKYKNCKLVKLGITTTAKQKNKKAYYPRGYPHV